MSETIPLRRKTTDEIVTELVARLTILEFEVKQLTTHLQEVGVV